MHSENERLCHNFDMDKHQVLSKLRQHESELKAAGVVHLSLFGSVARDEATTSSDVDLMAEFDGRRKLSLLDMVGLENRLSDLLQVKVDLTPAKTMKERVRKTADKEAVIAF
jgi:predicted nucleotidyltransferase